MKKFIIVGSKKGVRGSVDINGAKNSCLPIMASSILFNGTIILRNVPFVDDVKTMVLLLKSLGSTVETSEKNKIIKIINKKKHKLIVPYNLVSKMRAGVLTMGALLGKYNSCSVSKPGGCSLGPRDYGWHLKGFNKLGAENKLRGGYINLSAKKGLSGNTYKFPKVTVTGTSNLIMAAVLTKGITTLKNISIEPEVIDLITFLKNGGAKIKQAGKRTIKIFGVKKLLGCSHKIIGDRIEAFSYLCAGVITKGNIRVNNINPNYLLSELKVLKKIGCNITIKNSAIELKIKKKLKPVKIKTAPYPGFATDNMPPLMAVLSKVEGISEIYENVFGSYRFQAAPELARMGASIKVKNNRAVIFGKDKLYGAECICSDLRTTFSIILGAIAANGISKINRVYHGQRGYYKLDKKLKKIGIKIKTLT